MVCATVTSMSLCSCNGILNAQVDAESCWVVDDGEKFDFGFQVSLFLVERCYQIGFDLLDSREEIGELLFVERACVAWEQAVALFFGEVT